MLNLSGMPLGQDHMRTQVRLNKNEKAPQTLSNKQYLII